MECVKVTSCNYLFRDTFCQYMTFINFQAANIITEQFLNIQFSSIVFSIWDQLSLLTNEQRGPLDSELIIWTQKTYGGFVDAVSRVNDLFLKLP